MQPGKGWPKVGKTGTDLPYTPTGPLGTNPVLQPVAFPQLFLGPKQSHLPRLINDLPHVAFVNDLEGTQQPAGWTSA